MGSSPIIRNHKLIFYHISSLLQKQFFKEYKNQKELASNSILGLSARLKTWYRIDAWVPKARLLCKPHWMQIDHY